ncbi:MAG TPA: ABC transporter permease [Candidatus Mailhella merdigallinarum]|uniref:ABC transporter permease n=1 Tax=Candidatus Mailhella merdigallinarum TaxID=2838658 RepID=A0A9D2HEY3_9BACT|nr:ABC transporter permease [Desulfovibrionaceae bacterium]PWM66821.1 MAG: ABC transporter permease [Desulfovibrionaceae bacterium]HJA08555.1 ABC transporter permease [Candidatus Mailhella merdigallinarum]
MAVTKTQQGLTRSLLLAPAALWIIGFFILPYLLLAYMSFKPTSSTGPYLPGFTLENYIFNLTDPFYWEIMFETVAQGVLTVVICLLLAYPVAYRLARGNSRHKGFWYTLVISPLLVGVVIRCYGWMVLLADKGLINDGLLSLGLIDAPLPLMYNRLGTMIGMIQVYLPYMVISLTGSIQAVNPELDYTARSLGASRFTAFRKITLPMSLPGILSGSIMVFVLTISSYAIPILLGGNRIVTTPLLIVQNTLEAFDWPGGASMAVIMFVVVVTLLTLYIKLMTNAMRGLK